jgi:hypothetical protein
VGPGASRRVLFLALAVAVACLLGLLWLRRGGFSPSVEERARDKAAEIQEKARDATR